MQPFRIPPLIETRAGIRHRLPTGLMALGLGLTVFYIDTFTTIESAIAVLYVIVLLLVGEIATRAGVIAAAALCAILIVSSYVLSHGNEGDLSIFLRLLVAIAALVITAILLLRNGAFQAQLINRNLALRESEVRYRAIFDQARVALWERDYSAVLSYLQDLKAKGVRDFREHARANPDVLPHCINLVKTVAANEAARELLGPVAAQTGGMRNLIVPDDSFIDLVAAVFNGDSHFEGKGNVRTASGELRLVLVSISFPEDPSGFDRVVVALLDITQRELAQQALVEARAELTRASRAATVGALSASLAHELNQPLGAIVVNAQTLMRWLDRDPPDLGAVRRSAERMIRDSQRASDIIQNTRDMLSHTGREAEWIDLRELVEETRALMEYDFQRHSVAFEWLRREEIPNVHSVRIELQQVLINLLTNAVQAMSDCQPETRRIEVSLSKRDAGFIGLSVRDTGSGIPDDVMDRIFAPFYTTKSSGMGMGLSICRSTLEAHGGRLDGFNHAESGAVFEMTIPIEDQHA